MGGAGGRLRCEQQRTESFEPVGGVDEAVGLAGRCGEGVGRPGGNELTVASVGEQDQAISDIGATEPAGVVQEPGRHEPVARLLGALRSCQQNVERTPRVTVDGGGPRRPQQLLAGQVGERL